MKRIYVFGILVVVLQLVWWGYATIADRTQQKSAFHGEVAGSIRERALKLADQSGPVLGVTDPVTLVAPYPVKPDNRFVQAFGYIARIISPEAPALEATVSHQPEGGWAVRIGGGTPVAILPEISNFQDYLKALTAWATQILNLDPQKSGVDLRAYAFHPSLQETVAALDALDTAWRGGVKTPELLGTAARYFADVMLRASDPLSRDTDLAAHALATLALARAGKAAPDVLRHVQTALAYWTGYTAYAEAEAQKLPEADPLRAYVLKDFETLKTLAGKQKDGFALSLYLSTVTDPTDQDRTLRDTFLATNPDSFLARRSIQPSDGDFWAPLQGSLFLAHRSVSSVIQRTFSPGSMSKEQISGMSNLGVLINQFESALAAWKAERTDRVFLSAAATEAFFRQSFYGAFYGIGRFFEHTRSDSRQMTEFMENLRPDSPVPLERLLRTWMGLRLAFFKGQRLTTPIGQTLTDMAALGRAPLADVFSSYMRSYAYGDMASLRAARDLYVRYADMVPWLPSQLSGYAQTAWGGWLDPQGSEVYARWDVRLTGRDDTWSFARMAYGEGVPEAFAALFAAPLTDRDVRLLTRLNTDLLILAPPDKIRPVFEAWIGKAPQDYDRYRAYIHYLEHKRIADHATALRVVREWLAQNQNPNDFSILPATAIEARQLRRLGRTKEALQVLAPEMASMHGLILSEAIFALLDAGQSNQARSILDKAQERYPSFYGSVETAVLWGEGRYGEAAATLEILTGRDEMNMDEIALFFTRRFPTDTDEARRALTAMSGYIEGNPAGQQTLTSVMSFLSALRNAGRAELVWQVRGDLLRLFWPQNRAFFYTEWYLDALAAKGADAATGWFNGLDLGNFDRNEMSMGFMEAGKNLEPVWTLIPEPEKGRYPEYVWLIRAVGESLTDFADATRRNALISAFKGFTHTNYVVVMGRCLVGLATEREAIQGAQSNKELAEVLFFLGVKAASEKNYAKATAWMQEAIAVPGVSPNRVREVVWATHALDRWARHDSIFLSKRTDFW